MKNELIFNLESPPILPENSAISQAIQDHRVQNKCRNCGSPTPGLHRRLCEECAGRPLSDHLPTTISPGALALSESIRQKRDVEELRRLFCERRDDELFAAVGIEQRPSAPRNIRIWIGYEILTDSTFFRG